MKTAGITACLHVAPIIECETFLPRTFALDRKRTREIAAELRGKAYLPRSTFFSISSEIR